MEQGICHNPVCPSAERATPVDRYPGPGEYCPECGELLQPIVKAAPPAAAAPPPAPAIDGMSPLQALQRLDVARQTVFPRRRRQSLRPYALATGMLIIATGVTGGGVASSPQAETRHARTTSAGRERFMAGEAASWREARQPGSGAAIPGGLSENLSDLLTFLFPHLRA